MALPQETQVEETKTATLHPVEAVTTGRTPTWLGWSALGIMIVAAGILAVQVVGGADADNSFEVAEQIRQQQLAGPVPSGDGFDFAENQRFNALAPAIDESSQTAETQRFYSYAPSPDGQSVGAGTGGDSDGSSERAEESRMRRLAPATSDGSFESNEHNRMIALDS